MEYEALTCRGAVRKNGADVEWLMDKLNLGWIVSSDASTGKSYQFVAHWTDCSSKCHRHHRRQTFVFFVFAGRIEEEELFQKITQQSVRSLLRVFFLAPVYRDPRIGETSPWESTSSQKFGRDINIEVVLSSMM